MVTRVSLRCPLCGRTKRIDIAPSVFEEAIIQYTGYGFDKETIEPVMCTKCNIIFDLKTHRVLHFSFRGVLIGLRWI